MANQNNSFDINGKLNIDVTSANKAIQRLAKDFESLEKTRGISRLSDDLKKLQPVIGAIDKGFSGFIDKLAKTTAFDRVKQLTSTLEDQKNRLKQYTMEVDNLTKKLNNLPVGSKQYQKLSGQRDSLVEQGRITASGMENTASEKQRYQDQLSAPRQEFLNKSSRIIELMNMGMQNAAAIATRASMFNVMGQAQASMPGNMLGQMMLYNPMTFAAISKDLGAGMTAANQSAHGQLATKFMGDTANTLAAGVAAGATTETGASAIWKGTAGATTHAVKTLAEDPYYYMPQTKQTYYDAKYGQERTNVLQAVLQNKQLATQINEEIGSKAPMRVGAYEAMGGRYGSGVANFYQGERAAGAGLGFYEQETAGLVTQLGRSGLGSGAVSGTDFQKLQRQGFGGASQLAGMMAGMGGMLQNKSAPEQMREFTEALKTGVKLGVDDSSLGTDFAKAISDMGNSIGGPLSSIQNLQGLLGSALSGQDINAGTISRGAKAASFYQDLMGGGNSEIGTAQNIQSVNEIASSMGVQLSTIEQAGLGSMKDFNQLTPLEEKTLKKKFGKNYKSFIDQATKAKRGNILNLTTETSPLDSGIPGRAASGKTTEEDEEQLRMYYRMMGMEDVTGMANLALGKKGSFSGAADLNDKSAGTTDRAALGLITGTEQTRNEIAEHIQDLLTQSFEDAGKKIKDAFSDPKNVMALFNGGAELSDNLTNAVGGKGDKYHGEMGEAFDVLKESKEIFKTSIEESLGKDSDFIKILKGISTDMSRTSENLKRAANLFSSGTPRPRR